MFNMFKYSHITAKIHAMNGKMLNQTDYDQLMQQHTVRDAAIYLKNKTYYSDALINLDENDVHRGRLEIMLNRSLVSDELKIARYLKGEEKTTYRYVYRKLEIEDIKIMLRTLQMGKSIESIDKDLFFISKYSVLDFDRLINAKNIRELVNSLEGTNFYKILNPIVIDDENIDLFYAEMALDMYFYSKLEDVFKSITNRANKKVLRVFFGIEADMKNIIWIYRSKKYYNISNEITYRYLIPHHYKLNKKVISKLIESKTIEEFVNILKSIKYYFEFENNAIENEKILLEIQLKNYKKYLQTTSFNMAPITAYIFKKEIEISNITTIIEGIRYNVAPDKIKQLVIGI